MLAQLAAGGLGVATLPASVARSRPDPHALAITDPELRGRLAFAWRAEGPSSPAARAFVDGARRMLEH
ncbi:LysR substrate-binding domain-containing protein [Pseudonocardia sp.]|uniref:LysR substrate-binding domain-containing protein n=1 Tax=Pseudonocardia sp. TaxID=60912 RepID=UPI0039C94CF3